MTFDTHPNARVEAKIKMAEAWVDANSIDGLAPEAGGIICVLIEQIMKDAEALVIAGKGWDMLHFGCDNYDHLDAYKTMAPVFIGPTS